MIRKRLGLCVWIVCLPLVSAQVVINEFHTGLPNYVELINLGPVPVSVSGWTVTSYQSSAGTPLFEGVFTIPNGRQIPAGGTILLQEGGISGNTGSQGSCSLYTGGNYSWNSSKSIVVILKSPGNLAEDYVYRRVNGTPGAPFLPTGVGWNGSFSGVGYACARLTATDADQASEWGLPGQSTPCQLNPGQPSPTAASVAFTLASTAGDVTLSISTQPQAPGGEFYSLFSAIDHAPNGSGPVFGVGIDALSQLSWPVDATGPFHNHLDGQGAFSFYYPPGSVPPGLFVEGVCVLVDSTGVRRSDVVSITF